MQHNRVHVGCSGWSYKHWRGTFYPAEMPVSRWFAHYALSFDTVEIKNSFHRLPDRETFAKWREQAPPHFLYAVKASRYLTHMKKLEDPEEPLSRFFRNAKELGRHFGPVLYQLPPRWPLNLERLECFLEALGRPALQQTRGTPSAAGREGRSLRSHAYGHVLEFREPSWYDDRAYTLMTRHRVALCLHDMQGSATGMRTVGPFVYVRFHGWTKYSGRYSDDRLDAWADWLAAQASEGRDIFVYFNNDVAGHAARDAVRLRERLHRRLGL